MPPIQPSLSGGQISPNNDYYKTKLKISGDNINYNSNKDAIRLGGVIARHNIQADITANFSNIRLLTGSGNDYINHFGNNDSVDYQTFSGEDFVGIGGNNNTGTINLGADNDRFDLSQGISGNQLTVDGGEGEDTLSIDEILRPKAGEPIIKPTIVGQYTPGQPVTFKIGDNLITVANMEYAKIPPESQAPGAPPRFMAWDEFMAWVQS